MPFDWLALITIVGVVEAATALSFWPAFRHDWRSWRNIKWEHESLFMYPPVFVNGALWAVLQAINALGLFWVTREASDSGVYVSVMSTWIVSFFVFTLWGVPWEMELPPWSLVAWTLSWLLSVAACVLSYFVDGALIGAILFTVYAGLVGIIVVSNWLLAFSDGELRMRWNNPLVIWLENGGWPPNRGQFGAKKTVK